MPSFAKGEKICTGSKPLVSEEV